MCNNVDLRPDVPEVTTGSKGYIYSVVLVSIRQILLVIVLFLEGILESSLVLVLGGSKTCSFSCDYL